MNSKTQIQPIKNRFKLKWRILMGYTVPILLSFGMAGLVYSKAQTVAQLSEDVMEAQLINAGVDEIAYGISRMVRNVRGYVLFPDDQTYLTSYQKGFALFQEKTQELASWVQAPETRQDLATIQSLGEEQHRISQRIFELINQEKLEEAKKLTLSLRMEEIDVARSQISEQQNQVFRHKSDQLNLAMNRLTWIVTLGTLIAAILAVFLGLYIASRISETISQSINLIAISSSQIAATTEQQERNIAQQASAVNQTTTTVNELSASASSTAEQAKSSAENAHRLLTLAESSEGGANQVLHLAEASAGAAHQVLNKSDEGTKVVKQTLAEIGTLKQKVEAISEQMSHLNQHMNQISSITNMVSDLASQTNMLALNAAVEAVRAGEQGRGFSIVASEIRKLADQSRKSAEHINGLILEIKTAMNVTHRAIQEGQKTAEESIKLSHFTAESFVSVTEAIDIVLKASSHVTEAISEIVLENQKSSLHAINDIVVNAQQISLSSQQQAQAIQQVVEAMTNLNQAAQQTVVGINQTKVGIQQLNEVAQNLEAVV